VSRLHRFSPLFCPIAASLSSFRKKKRESDMLVSLAGARKLREATKARSHGGTEALENKATVPRPSGSGRFDVSFPLRLFLQNGPESASTSPARHCIYIPPDRIRAPYSRIGDWRLEIPMGFHAETAGAMGKLRLPVLLDRTVTIHTDKGTTFC